MATINDIVNLDSYKGNPSAGGATGAVYDINTKPLEQLGLYTNFYQKTLYDQTEQDKNAKLQQVAQMAQIDANNLFGKDKDTIVKKLNNLQTVAAAYAKNPNITLDDQLKWQTALSDVQNDYNSGKQRALSYQSQLNDLNTNKSGEQKSILLKELNDKFSNTDISTPISAGTGYKPVAVDIPSPATIDGNTLLNGSNQVVNATWKVFNPQANAALASSTSLGLKSLMDNPNKTESDLQETADGQAQLWAGMQESFNSVLTSKNPDGSYRYFDSNGTFNQSKFKQDNAANTTIMQPFDALMNLSSYSQQKKNEVAQGMYSDKGINYKAPSNLSPDMFDAGIVNITPDGVNSQQLIMAGMYQKYAGDVVSKKYTKTGLGIEQENAATNRGKLGLGWAKLSFEKSKEANKTDKADKSGIQNPAILFGSHIDRVKTYLEKHPDKKVLAVPFKEVDLDTRQALNMDDKDAFVTFKPDGSYVVTSKNGKTRVGTLDELKQGYIDVVKGGKTPTQNTSFQSGAEGEFNKTFGSNVGQDIWNNWNDGGKSSQDNSQKAKPLADPTLDNNASNWKDLGDGTYQYIDGSIYNAKGKKVK